MLSVIVGATVFYLAGQAVVLAVVIGGHRERADRDREALAGANDRIATLEAGKARLERLTSDLGERIDTVSTSGNHLPGLGFVVATALHRAANLIDCTPCDGLTPEETADSLDEADDAAAAVADKAMCG